MSDVLRFFFLRLICCGRDDGIEVFDSWGKADEFRQSYTSGPGVDDCGRYGHDRAAILSAVQL